MKIIQAFITKDTSYQNNVNKVDSRYTTFQQRGPLGLMLHSVGTAQPSAEVFAKGWNRPGREASVHAVLQADGTVYQTMPWNFRAWHCGGDANNTHVGIEMTEPGCIKYTGGANFTCSNLEEARAQVRGTYQTAVDLFAYLCKLYRLDPLKNIISHYEGYRKGVASGHGDPEHLWNGLNMGYTMDGFRKAVKAKMEGVEDLTQKETQALIDKAIEKITFPQPSKAQILTALGDTWINTYADLPEWAKPEVMELIRMGALKGKKPVENPEETVIDGSLEFFIRPAIVAYRMAKKLAENTPKEALANELEKLLEQLRGTD